MPRVQESSYGKGEGVKESKPTKHTLDNRKAGDALMREAAMRGEEIAGAFFELQSITGGIQTSVDYDDEDWDDVRPY